MGRSNLTRGLGVVVLAIAAMECGYRLLFWYWTSASDPGHAAAYAAQVRTWLTATVIVVGLWMYLAWKLLVEDRSARKDTANKTKGKKTQV